ncbi:MAG: hypothetical protein HUU20_21305 [Pirellulales bacterium]|nr:hypothetical protein [Pirellulales bacterium]
MVTSWDGLVVGLGTIPPVTEHRHSGVGSPLDGFRFIVGDDLPPVLNTYTANIDETAGTVSPVEFELGGPTLTDNDPTGGWT